jgi:signal transduction histidine kinase
MAALQLGRDVLRLARPAVVVDSLLVLTAFAVSYLIDDRLVAAGRPDLRQGGGVNLLFVVATLISLVVGSALLLRRPSHPVGWCFAALAASLALAGVAQSYGVYGLLARPGSLPGAGAAATVASALFILWLIVIALVCSLTPTGRHLSIRWRRADQVMLAAGALWLVTVLITPGPLESPFRTVNNGWGVDGARPLIIALRSGAAIVNNVLVLAAVVSLVIRFRRSTGDERRQLLWMVVFAVPFPVLLVVAFVAAKRDDDVLVNAAAAGFVVLLPVGAGLAVSRYHLYDVERVLSRALAYLLVCALMAGAYVVVVVLAARAAGHTVSHSPVAVAVATLGVTVATRPVYRAVQDVVDRRFARRRYEALRRVREYVSAPSGAPVEAVLQAALADPGLRVAYWVADRSRWVTAAGLPATPGDQAIEVRRVGRLVAMVEPTSNWELARAVCLEAAAELDNTGLRAAIAMQLEEVRASRARIAAAQLEERRRIERNLHDGAQQRLLALAAHLQAGLLNGAPDRLRAALELGVAESRSAVVELRELANGLHPSVLNDGGLGAALEDLAGRLPIRLRIGASCSRYAEPVEAAAWFVVCEAVANAVKHAGPATVEVAIDEVDAFLRVSIIDDGVGGADRSGPGLRGLADRVEAVGGRMVLQEGRPGGTRIEVVLPCAS